MTTPGGLIGQLEERRAANVAAMHQIAERGRLDGNRGPTAEESARFDTLDAESREIGVRIDQLRHEAAMETRAARARAVGRTGFDAMEIKSEHRLRRGQSMTEYLGQRIASERLARGGAPDQEFNAGAYFRGMVTGKWGENDGYERRALAEGSVSGGGALVPIDLYANIIDIVRNSARVLQAGATVVPLEHYLVNVAKLTADPSPSWRAEGGTIGAAGSTFSRLQFLAQSLAVVVVVSRELLEDVPSLGDEIQRELALEFALGLDLAALYGTGHSDNQPQGVKGTSGVTETSMGDDGAAPSSLSPNPWVLLTNACYRLLAANEYGLSGAIMAPRTEQELVTAGSTINTFIEPPSRLNSIGRYGTSPLEVYSTNQVPVNLTQGDASTATDLFVADWSQLLIGLRTGLQIQVLSEAYAGTGQIGFLGWLRADVVVARPSAFDVTVGIL